LDELIEKLLHGRRPPLTECERQRRGNCSVPAERSSAARLFVVGGRVVAKKWGASRTEGAPTIVCALRWGEKGALASTIGGAMGMQDF
jgi:hypothetical protein